jgi:two-component system, LytTR family, response regulator
MRMSALRVAIVDDEPLARARLSRLLERQPDIDVVGSYADGAVALEALSRQPTDLVFLDIRMPEVDGFALLDRLPPTRRPLVVFVTAYRAHALDAFDVQAVDYLLKPLSEQRLAQALGRVRDLHALRMGNGQPTLADSAYPKRIAVPDRGRMRMIDVADIIHVTARSNYVEVAVGGTTYLLRETMMGFASRLDPAQFVRIHRSRIVRIDMIEQVEPYGAAQYWLRLRNGHAMKSGRSYRNNVRAALGLPH